MKEVTLLIFLLIPVLAWAQEDGRYLDDNKVVYEAPLESDVLKINTTLGFCTVLAFKEKPIMVTVGDNSLIQIEIPQNSKSVIIKPIQASGETNLFVFTKSQRFNYKVVIADQSSADYVVDTKDSISDKDIKSKGVDIDAILKLARNYSVLKDLRAVNDRILLHKDLFYSYTYHKFKVDIIEGFINRLPNYLIVHIIIHNMTDYPLILVEKNTHLLIGQQSFTPQYILFDTNKVKVNGQTNGWLVFEDSYISMDNKFECQISIKDNYVW
jgi:hypothetical protein